MSNPATLADLRSLVQAGVRRIGKSFTAPDDDWTPACFIQTPSGIDLVALEMPLGAVEKTMVADLLKRLVAERGAYRYALLLNVHALEGVSEDDLEAVRREQTRIEYLPGAIEKLILLVGDAESEDVSTAVIERHAYRPPTLGPWERPEFDAIAGRFIGLNEYLRQPR